MSIIVKGEPVDDDSDDQDSHPSEIINWDDVLCENDSGNDDKAVNGKVINTAAETLAQAPTPSQSALTPPRPLALLEPKKEEEDIMDDISADLMEEVETMLGMKPTSNSTNTAATADFGDDGDDAAFYDREMLNTIGSYKDTGTTATTTTTTTTVSHPLPSGTSTDKPKAANNEEKAASEVIPQPPPLPPRRPLGYNIRIISSDSKDDVDSIDAPCVATTGAILTSAVRSCGRMLRDIFLRHNEPLVAQYMYIACTESHLCQDVIYWWFHDKLLDEATWLSIVQDPRESVAGLERFAIICYLAILSKYSKKLTKREADIAHAIMEYCVIHEREHLATPMTGHGMDSETMNYLSIMQTNDVGIPLLPPMTVIPGIEDHQPPKMITRPAHFNAFPDPHSTHFSCCTTIMQRCGDNNFTAAATSANSAANKPIAIDLTADVVYEKLFCIVSKLLDYQTYTFAGLRITQGGHWGYQFDEVLSNGSKVNRIITLAAPRDGHFEMFNLATHVLHHRARRNLKTEKATSLKRDLTILDCLPYRFKLHAIQYVHQENTELLGGIKIKKEPGSSAARTATSNSKKRESKPRQAKLAGGGKVTVKKEDKSVAAATTKKKKNETKAIEVKKEEKGSNKKKIKKEEGEESAKDKKAAATSSRAKVKTEPTSSKVTDTPATTTITTTTTDNAKKRKLSAGSRNEGEQQSKQKRRKIEAGSGETASAAMSTFHHHHQQQQEEESCSYMKGCTYSQSRRVPHSSNCAAHIFQTQSPTEFLRSSRGGHSSPTFAGEEMELEGDSYFPGLQIPTLGNNDYAAEAGGNLRLPSTPLVTSLPPITSGSEGDGSAEQGDELGSDLDDGEEDNDNSSDDDDDEDEEEGENVNGDQENDETDFKICEYCSKRYKRAPRHGQCATCPITCKSQKAKSKDKAKRVQQPHYQFNESSSAGFRDFLSSVLKLDLDNPNFLEAYEYIVSKGRVKNIAMESCFGCRTGSRFCCQCVLAGRINPGHIFIGLMRADNNGNHKVRIAYICSAKCLQLIRAGSGGLNTAQNNKYHSAVTVKTEPCEDGDDSNADHKMDISMAITGEEGGSSIVPSTGGVMVKHIVQRYYYPEGRPGNSAKSRDVFHIEHDELPITIVKFNLRNAAKLV